ncbi:MAG: hypothetical protein RBR69_07330 [Candidatus Cloacimonadaceae bacterium]|jgi:hypothetical protein|nr:hypothetical protein [Candidatus Cloacimonadota bacterium]MDY0127925.1 hypothetical protein [Candidatus Cloacimonadaceae bacterium]MCB5255284.1 hypothetical protein [Candidatus Cloacimonadota bacterium]MCK9177994.1 hypothetical protein [Candidatus Cloacimonadota bacterium]MCK9242934.1 hypothetical protein [Candidatus Cloacimonadota bacterium]
MLIEVQTGAKIEGDMKVYVAGFNSNSIRLGFIRQNWWIRLGWVSQLQL